jgi:hypothetical protein
MKFITLGTERTRLRRKLSKAIRNGENYVMTKPTQAFTQSGLLAVLLQWQRYRVIQLARRSAHRKRVHAAFWNTFTWARRTVTAPTPVDRRRHT